MLNGIQTPVGLDYCFVTAKNINAQQKYGREKETVKIPVKRAIIRQATFATSLLVLQKALYAESAHVAASTFLFRIGMPKGQ